MQPVPADLLRGVVNRALAVASLEREHRRRAALGTGMPDLGMVGESQAIVAVRRQIGARGPHRRQRDHRGRERHRQGGRRAGAPRRQPRARPGVRGRSTARRSPRRCSRASCSATSAAPSPAPSSSRRGCFEHANGGTLFLDEIGELPLGAAGQAAARPAGAGDRAGRRHAARSRSTCASSARPTATSSELMRDGHVPRGPLLPPDRDRPRICRRCASAHGDAVLLAKHFLAQHRRAAPPADDGFTADALRSVDALPLARQRPRAREHGQARGHHGVGTADQRPTP